MTEDYAEVGHRSEKLVEDWGDLGRIHENPETVVGSWSLLGGIHENPRTSRPPPPLG